MNANRSEVSTRRGPAGADVLRDGQVYSSGAEMGAVVDTECHCTCRISCCTFGGIRKLAGLFRCPLRRRKRKESKSDFSQAVAPQTAENVGTRSIASNEIELNQPATPPPPPPPPSLVTRDSPPRFRASFVPTTEMLQKAKAKLKPHQDASAVAKGGDEEEDDVDAAATER